jgi:hypothetical protein
MIRSRVTASRAPPAPLGGRYTPLDPSTRSQTLAAIRSVKPSGAGSTITGVPQARCVAEGMQVSGHRWMAVRETRRPRIVGNPSQSDGLGIFDERAEHAASLGEFADCLGRLLVHTDMQELFEQAISADDSQCGVPGVRDISRGADNAVQHSRQGQLLND